jgi:hypothetical protein
VGQQEKAESRLENETPEELEEAARLHRHAEPSSRGGV